MTFSFLYLLLSALTNVLALCLWRVLLFLLENIALPSLMMS